MKKNINLLPVELQKKVSEKTQKNLLMILSALIIGTVLIGFSCFFVYIKYCEHRLTALNGSIEDVVPKDAQEKYYQEENKKLETEISNLEKITQGRISWTTILEDMNNHLPRNMWITGFSYGQDKKIKITGLTMDVSGVGVFIYELNQLGYISGLSLEKIDEVQVGDMKLNKFFLNGTLVKGSD